MAAALALSAAACGGGDGATSSGDGAANATSTTGAGSDAGSGGETAATDTGSTGAGSGDITSAETAPLQLTDLKPNKYGAPLPGRYLYDVAGTDDLVELSVQDVLGDQGADRFDRTGDLAQLHIETEKAERRASLVHWSARGLHLDAEQRAQNTTSGPNESAVCDYRPDLALRPDSLEVGATWEDESTCVAGDRDVEAKRRRKVTGEVVSASTADVDGHSVQTLRIRSVIDTTTTTNTDPPLMLTEHREVTMDWIIASGLAARAEGTIVETISGTPKPPRIYTWTLRSLTPVG